MDLHRLLATRITLFQQTSVRFLSVSLILLCPSLGLDEFAQSQHTTSIRIFNPEKDILTLQGIQSTAPL